MILANFFSKEYKVVLEKVQEDGKSFVEIEEEVLGFIYQQRELLYISVGGELALGRIDTDALPGYVAAIEQKVTDLEIELGCTMPAAQ